VYEIRDGRPIKEVSLDRSQSRLAVRYGKEKEERKDKAMIARFDHRPMLTAVLALTTTALFVVVVTLSTLLITAAPQAVAPTSGGVGENPPVMGAGGEHYGEGWNNYGWNVQPKAAQNGEAGGENYGWEPHLGGPRVSQ
jgi:hypothetical protein